MFIVALFTVARTWKQSRCPSTGEWIKKLWYIYTMDYHSDIKRNTFESVLMRWMNLEPIIQKEVSQRENDKHHILKQYTESRKMALKNLFLQGIQKNLLLKGNNVETDIENTLLDMGRGEERVRCMERVTWKLTLPYVK